MYRDDTCAVCGASLPPDHFYCREHAATVDERLHEIGALLPRVAADVGHLAELLDQVAEETWDYLAEQCADEAVWPPMPAMTVQADADEITVDVDTEPGYVQVDVHIALARLLDAVRHTLSGPELAQLAAAAAKVHGANATH